MSLLQFQRQFVDACFSEHPDPAALAALGGDEKRWRVYRHMVRSRLWSMVKAALPRSHALLGEDALGASHTRFLAAGGPRSRFIREVTADFARFALADDSLDAPPALRDLLRFELCKWELAYLPTGVLPPLRDVDFEAVAVLNPVFRVERFDHAVHAGPADAPPPAESTRLFIYRPKGVDGVRWWSVDPFAAALFERLLASSGTLVDAVRAAAEQTGQPLDQALLERLSTLLTLAVERGVLLGSRAD